MLSELELPRVLAPDFSSDCYSLNNLGRAHSDRGPSIESPRRYWSSLPHRFDIG